MWRVCRYYCLYKVIFCNLTLSNSNFDGTHTFHLRQIWKDDIVFYAFYNVMDSYWHFVIYFKNGHKYIKWLLFIEDYLQIMTFPSRYSVTDAIHNTGSSTIYLWQLPSYWKGFGNSFVSTLVSDFNQWRWSASICYEQEITFNILKMKNKNSLYVQGKCISRSFLSKYTASNCTT